MKRYFNESRRKSNGQVSTNGEIEQPNNVFGFKMNWEEGGWLVLELFSVVKNLILE